MVDSSETRRVDRRVEVQDRGGREHYREVVESTNAGRRLIVSRVAQLIWLAFGVLEALIGLRVLFKLIAANPDNLFAQVLYAFTDLFLWPFQGLTATPSVQGMVLEIPSIIAMIVYALIGWVFVRLVWLLFYQSGVRRMHVVEHEHDHIVD